MTGSRLKGRSPLKGASLLDEFEKDRVKESVDIVDLISSSGVSLVEKGASWMGRCPFHEDKSPSLSVNREKGLFNCFGCGAGGDVFDFVMKSQGVEFKEALSILKSGSSTSLVKSKEVLAKSDPSKVDSSTSLSSVSLQDISSYYQKHLTDPKATAYLKSRGLYAPELLARLQIGYSPGDLKDKLSEGQRKELKDAGILNDKGYESFSGCITFPLFDSTGQIVGLYGRKVDNRSKLKHLYLKGPHKGLFNHKAFKVYPDRIILTESIIDALSLMVLGFDNVSCIYGTNGVTSDLLTALKENRVKEVVLGFDNDDPGRQAAEKVAQQLIETGLSVRTIFPPEKDWNQAQPGLSKNDVLSLIDTAPLQTIGIKPGSLTREQDIYTYTGSTLTYRIIGVKEGAVSSMKVNLRCQKSDNEDVKFIDNVDLFSARSRILFSSSAGRKFTEDAALVEKDLLTILDLLELASQQSVPTAGIVNLSAEDEKQGLALLRDPDLFNRIVQDTETLGYVGEDENKILMYLAASSRLMADPVSVIVISQSAAGKSYMIDTVKKLMPDEDVVSMTSLSDQALNYLPEEALLHKFLVMGEAVHSDAVDHQMREMLSGKELSRLVTTKDEKTGKMASKLVRKKVIVSAVMSSTSTEINPENASRCFVINTDESEDQTRAIHRRQREKYSLEGYRRKEEEVPHIIRTHQAAQRLLREKIIVNPFAGQLDFPSSLMRSRRDHERFVDLIACVCFLRQYQKEEKIEEGKRFIECDLDDYKVAYRIMKGILSSTMTTVPKSAVLLYEELRSIIKARAEKDGLFITDIWVTQRQIRETSGLSHDLVKKNMRILVDYEYIRVKGSGRGMTCRYSLSSDSDLVLFDESVIPAPDRLTGFHQSGATGAKVGLE